MRARAAYTYRTLRVWVRPHQRGDGTFVRGHWRTIRVRVDHRAGELLRGRPKSWSAATREELLRGLGMERLSG